MPKNTPSTAAQQQTVAADTIERLLFERPTHTAGIKALLEGVDVAALRQAICYQLTTQYCNSGDRSFLIAALEIIGLGEQASKLIQTVTQTLKSTAIRAGALDALLRVAPQSFVQIEQLLTFEKTKKLMDYQFLETLEAAGYDYASSVTITECLLAAQELGAANNHLAVFETLRPQASVLAALVYAHALRCQELALVHPKLLELVRQEGGAVAEMLLTDLRNTTLDSEQRRVIQATLMQTLTDASTKPKTISQADRVTAYVGSCDGQGAFMLLGRFRHKLNKEQTTACLCLWATGEIRDAYTLPYQTDGIFEQLFEKFKIEGQQIFTQIPPEHAAALVYDAYQAMQNENLSIPPEAQTAVGLFLSAYTGHHSLKINKNINIIFSTEDLRDVLSEDNFDTWFFDESDLSAVGVKKPKRRQNKPKWFTQAAKNLANTSLTQRVSAMARHMAHWYTWHQDIKQAYLFTSLADITEQDFEQSPLVLAMLERTYDIYVDFVRSSPNTLLKYTEGLRYHMRSRFFANVKDPSRHDLATLDFCETANMLLDGVFSQIPGELRPNSEMLDQLSYGIAKAFVDSLWEDRDNTKLSYQAIEAALSLYTLPIPSKIKDFLISSIEEGMRMFVSTGCSQCPIGCLDHPSTQQREAFFHHTHPLQDSIT